MNLKIAIKKILSLRSNFIPKQELTKRSGASFGSLAFPALWL